MKELVEACEALLLHVANCTMDADNDAAWKTVSAVQNARDAVASARAQMAMDIDARIGDSPICVTDTGLTYRGLRLFIEGSDKGDVVRHMRDEYSLFTKE